MTTTPSALPELAEADAPPDIRAIYQEIRSFSGVPMVALIWRHLATRPGVLEQSWRVLRPLFEAGAVQMAAWGAAVTEAKPASLPRVRLEYAGLDDEGRTAFANVLDTYNRANPVNFVGVRILMRRSADKGPFAEPGEPLRLPPGWSAPVWSGAMPPMYPLSEFTPEQRGSVNALNSDPKVDRNVVVPSLYRHLVGWPGLIQLIHAELAPRFASGEMLRIIETIAQEMDGEADRLAAGLPASAVVRLDDDVRGVLDRFSSLIPEMVAVGLLLRGGLEI